MTQSFRSGLGALFTQFYSESELDVLEKEILVRAKELSKGNGFQALLYQPGDSDHLLRLQHTCFLAHFPSLPFFTAKIRNTIASYKLDVNRSIHFHPEPGFEVLYFECPSSATGLLESLKGIWKEDYARIVSLVSSFQKFSEFSKDAFFGENKDLLSLFDWLMKKALIWEGAFFQDSKQGIEYGEIPLTESRSWFESLSSPEEDVQFQGLDHSKIAYLGTGDLFSFAFIRKNQKLLIVGSFNEYAKGQALTDIPFFGQKFQDFLKSKSIEPLSGLGRTSRMMFNYIPTELLFLVPFTAYDSLHKALMEQSLRTSLGSVSLQLEKEKGLIAIFVPDSLWRDSIWRNQIQKAQSVFPGATFRQFEVLREKTIEAFFYINSNNITYSLLFDLASRIELEFRSWEELLAQKWTDRAEIKIELDLTQFDFSESYKATHLPEQALHDLSEFLTQNDDITLFFTEKDATCIAHSILPRKLVGLSNWIQVWNSMGLFPDHQTIYAFGYKDKRLEKAEFTFSGVQSTDTSFERWQETAKAVLRGKIALDPLLALVSKTPLDAKAISFLIPMKELLLQINPIWNSKEVNAILLRFPSFMELSWKRFHAMFCEGSDNYKTELQKESLLGSTIREDEILKCYSSLIESLLRTNFFGTKVSPISAYQLDFLAFKINSSMVHGIPKPVPFREIFVYSPSFQGVHLRGGKVARGGLRFSDRPGDYRTEVLSLWKTQTTKNSLIVPVGSKGCFVTTAHLFQKESITPVEAYKGYVRGLLCLTDSIEKGKINAFKGDNGNIPFTYDEIDPYLVVAADKGTAALSDVANSLSEERGFWLGDAFASGGTKGYSHKEFGITAKGALVTADRNLRSLGIDFKTMPVRVVAIGDMGGDVFGNGLIESPFFQLLGAFNHKHIFLDPNPDPKSSFEERKRLFFSEPSKSGWDSYNRSLISEGGGVFLRTEKEIPISPQVQKSLSIDKDRMSGPELISALLKANVDLLYNGGIGTYIKSVKEDNLSVGDPSNNEVRVNSDQIRAKVISEGGNLGLTQKARIELDENGILLFTDALDNSAGVDLSDHEVNLKILLSGLIQKGEFDPALRDQILKEVANEVAEDVLLDNGYQSLSVTIDRIISEKEGASKFRKALARLELWGKIHVKEQGIPTDPNVWDDWNINGIPRPVLCVLFSHVKIALYDLVLEYKQFSITEFGSFYETYFPKLFRSKFKQGIYEHSLANEILATKLVNFFVDLMGINGILLLPENKEKAASKLKQMLSFLLKREIHLALEELASKRDLESEALVRKTVQSVRQRIQLEFQESIPVDSIGNEISRFLSDSAGKNLKSFLES